MIGNFQDLSIIGEETKALIVRYLIRWIKVHQDGIDINWAFGNNYIKCILGTWDEGKKKAGNIIPSPKIKNPTQGGGCSNTLTIGVTDGARSFVRSRAARSLQSRPADLSARPALPQLITNTRL